MSDVLQQLSLLSQFLGPAQQVQPSGIATSYIKDEVVYKGFFFF